MRKYSFVTEWIGHAASGIIGATSALLYKHNKEKQLRDNEIDKSDNQTIITIIKKYISVVKKRLVENTYCYKMVMKFRNNPTDENAIQLIKYLWGGEEDEILDSYNEGNYSSWMQYFSDYDCVEIIHPEYILDYIKNDKKLLNTINECIRTNNITQLKMIIKKERLSNLSIDNKVKSHWSQKIPSLAYYSGGAVAAGTGYHYAKKGLKVRFRKLFKK